VFKWLLQLLGGFVNLSLSARPVVSEHALSGPMLLYLMRLLICTLVFVVGTLQRLPPGAGIPHVCINTCMCTLRTRSIVGVGLQVALSLRPCSVHRL
jgi:hypothetical protein